MYSGQQECHPYTADTYDAVEPYIFYTEFICQEHNEKERNPDADIGKRNLGSIEECYD